MNSKLDMLLLAKHGTFLVCFLVLACGAAGLWQEIDRANIQLYLQVAPAPGTAPLAQGRIAWQHPWWFLASVGRTIMKNEAYRQSFVGALAYLSILLPVWLLNVYLLLLAAVAMTQSPPVGFNGRARWQCAAVVVGTTLSLFVLMLILNTPVSETAQWSQGRGVITGIQGRYFIPFAPLGFALLANRRWHVHRVVMASLSTVVILIASGTAWVYIYDTYYRYWSQP